MFHTSLCKELMALLASKLSSFDRTEEDIRERMKARESATARERTTRTTTRTAVQEYDNEGDGGGGGGGDGGGGGGGGGGGVRGKKHSQMDNETDLHEKGEFKRAGVGFRSVVQPVEVSLDHKRAQELLNHRNKIMKERREQVEVNRYTFEGGEKRGMGGGVK
jgi:hypothetical protein